jgi:hypothetical protein
MSAPGPPILSVDPLSTSNTLQFYWDPPAVTPSPTLLGYNLDCIEYPGLGPFSYGASERYATVTGLSNGSNYTFRINASNSVGVSPFVNWQTYQPGTTVPNTPNTASATLSDNLSNVIITWTPPSVLPDSTIAWYAIEGYTDILQNALLSNGASGTQRSLVITGLPLNTSTFQFAVYAINYPGWSVPQYTSSITGAFTPLRVPNLRLWLDASDASTVIRSGANVTQWNDKSGCNYNTSNTITAGTITYSSNALNDKNVINFNSNGALGPLSVTSNAVSFFNVFYFNAAPRNDARVLALAAPGQPPYGGNGYTELTRNFSELATFRNATKNTLTATFPLQSWNQVGVKQTPNISYINSNGGTLQSLTTSISANFTISQYGIGRSTLAEGWLQGIIAESLVYSGDVSDSNRQTIEGYLAWKWGLQSKLPVGHPYKNAPP